MSKDIYTLIDQLVNYGLDKKLIQKEDEIWARNSLLELLNLKDYQKPELGSEEVVLVDLLDAINDYAIENEIIGDSITERDLFDTKVMGVITPRPSEIIREFNTLYEESPEKATDWYYDLSQDTNYIRKDRIAKDVKWKGATDYGDLDITINLSKPEKDPKAIALAGKTQSTSYPKCQLCIENEGYAGRFDHPARENHRIIPITIQDTGWKLQYSPYVYYNEHCIVLNDKHQPMVIDRGAFEKLFDFVDLFPHYFVGSNADLPIVGGSILSHEHFQGGHYRFAMEDADINKEVQFDGYDNVKAGLLNWPMSVIRLRGEDRKEVLDLAEKILKNWREYSDESVDILAYSDETPHNTITPIARKHGDEYEIDLVLRNNRTTDEYPLGIFHPHDEYHHIKKENIGLIEVMGLAVLPARLKGEIETIKDVLVNNKNPEDYEELTAHLDWINEMKDKYDTFTEENVDEIIQNEITDIFSHVLENAGVYKQDEKGQEAFLRFVESVQ